MISLQSVTPRRGAKVLLDLASVTINPGEKVGLVGRNGAEKLIQAGSTRTVGNGHNKKA